MSVVQFVNKSSGKFNVGSVPDVSAVYGYPKSSDVASVSTTSPNIQAPTSVKISAGVVGGTPDTSLEVGSDQLKIEGLNLPVVAGSASGNYLPININGTVYHLELLNAS